jgi:hypothetical protein
MKLFGCLAKFVGFLFLVAILGLAWLRFSEMRSEQASEGDVPASSAGSAEVAALVEARFEDAIESRAETVELTETELASLLQHAFNEGFPGGVVATGVTLSDGEARIRGRVALSLLPPMTWLDPVRRILPDQVPVEFRCAVLAVEEGAAVLLIRGFSVAGIPVPRSAYSVFLPELGAGESGDLPPEVIRVALPAEVSSVRIVEDRVVVGVPR